MSYEPREFLRHILLEADYLGTIQPTLTRASLDEDPTLQRAVVRSLDVIGEATKRVPAEIREAHPQVQWRSMARMRDRLVHDYFGVDLDIVWDVLQHKIPPLREELRRILGVN
jgi:uncharacterized protein with HEPN domain